MILSIWRLTIILHFIKLYLSQHGFSYNGLGVEYFKAALEGTYDAVIVDSSLRFCSRAFGKDPFSVSHKGSSCERSYVHSGRKYTASYGYNWGHCVQLSSDFQRICQLCLDYSTMFFSNCFFRSLFSYLRSEILPMKITCSSPRIILFQMVTKCKIRLRTIQNINGRRHTMYDAKNLQNKYGVAVYGRFIRCWDL